MLSHLAWLAPLLFVGLATTDNPWLQLLYRLVTVVSKRFSGIVGDARHQVENSYHNGRLLCRPGYSTYFKPDLSGDPVMSAGLDISFGPADMIAVTARLLVALRAKDPRVASLREANGTLNGRTTVNYDVTLGGQNYTPDSSHLWHFHGGFWRSIITVAELGPAAAAGVASVINGESLQDYLRRSGLGTSTGNLGDEVKTNKENDVIVHLKPGDETVIGLGDKKEFSVVCYGDGANLYLERDGHPVIGPDEKVYLAPLSPYGRRIVVENPDRMSFLIVGHLGKGEDGKGGADVTVEAVYADS